jgi:alpha-methylacyl-CoA racemase
MAEVFRQRTRDEWCSILEGTDACFAPVLTLSEAPDHPHHRARQAFVDVAGAPQNSPAPRFSRTAAAAPGPAVVDRDAIEALLAKWGCSSDAARRVLSAAQF